jgi:sortase (surface protein transpeptidase)
MVKNVREDMTLTVQDRIITLSTCPMRYWEKKRYLVQGVLISDERTKSGQANEPEATKEHDEVSLNPTA